ncbi:MAG: hypothetical protein N4A57_09755 [Anaeromicrobium sp.]|uniref:DUF6765 family protein n=1 Tax=Anaeromicrobium sp. TaxID=1929132 RepID=UPI0025DF3CDC|nr:DUF6765 family protein [Anaeromicrobium sp.]MCT4594539.1 hypothetical protein [Anaeromicrobium sp.]
MNIEFHYYMIYLIATRAGFRPESAKIMAISSQYVDDNDMIFTISKGTPEEYTNHISQTMNIIKPKKKLFRIYPLFHFIPGDPLALSARRKDGKLHMLNTTPNSTNVNSIFDMAIYSKNLYRIGIALHSFADTWAHQNFTGYYDTFNSVDGGVEKIIPYIGHASAYYYPDWPALIWKDSRLVGKYIKVNNRERFLEAAREIFRKLYLSLNPNETSQHVHWESKKLLEDLNNAIGKMDQGNEEKDNRIKRYKELARKKEYGGGVLEDYQRDKWFDQVVNEEILGIRDRGVIAINGVSVGLNRYDPLTDIYTWKNSKNYTKSHWYKFQEAVKTHQKVAFNILSKKNFSYLDLKNW